MRRTASLISALILVVLASCETESSREVRCFPKRMAVTIAGGETTKLTADFTYVPGTGLLDHITWSNKQTDYFEYNDRGLPVLVRMKKVGFKIQEELWFIYEDERLVRLDRCSRRLDIIYQEPVEGDSTFTGFHLYDYAGNRIGRERIYTTSDGKKTELAEEIEYVYDETGNVVRMTSTDAKTKKQDILNFSYHASHHPFSQIKFYFTGESFIHNIITKSDLSENLEVTYDIILDGNRYPQQVVERTNSVLSRVIQYTYDCR
ncbi:MAG: hypothetical protein JXR52_08330 [Bacteroidales bacterium]|nr:hypothetical protein [Bacteroidales bacterium]MBN2698818.1 hypothetical protein [Bacteroidales bacterium]